MTDPVILRGYRYSVYHRIVAMALREKAVPFEVVEVDPFTPPLPSGYLQRHPFGRVPVLSHGTTDIFETAAITRYIDAAFNGPQLTPPSAIAQARMTQVISIIDNYGYQPMIRQVFAHRVFRPALGHTADDALIADGIAAAAPVLGALNRIAAEGQALSSHSITLADCHLAPMLAYFAMAPEGQTALKSHDVLHDWWCRIAVRPSLIETDPGLPDGPAQTS